jgi:hypothetical protein
MDQEGLEGGLSFAQLASWMLNDLYIRYIEATSESTSAPVAATASETSSNEEVVTESPYPPEFWRTNISFEMLCVLAGGASDPTTSVIDCEF